MVNYGYECKDWSKKDKENLAQNLMKELNLDWVWIPGGSDPYIEIDGIYNGVRIRKMTHLSDEESENLVKKADKVYGEFVKRRVLREMNKLA